MISHFEQLEFLYGKDASVQIPNSLFRELSENIRRTNGDKNGLHVSFAYAYLVATAFLYKYAHFVDVGNQVYIQNSDLKEILGYSKASKSIDRIISKNGILESSGLTLTTRDYPVHFKMENKTEKKDRMRNFVFISELNEEDILYERIKKVVKNRNYEIKEPLFLTGDGDDEGTLMDFRNTHKITIREFLAFINNGKEGNGDFILYCYLKSKCQGNPSKGESIALAKILTDVGMESKSFYQKLNRLKEKGFIGVTHGKWKTKKTDQFIRMVANKYFWKGVS